AWSSARAARCRSRAWRRRSRCTRSRPRAGLGRGQRRRVVHRGAAEDQRADEIIELLPEKIGGGVVEEALQGVLVPKAEHGDERGAVAGRVHPGVDAHEAIVREERARALVAEPRLELVEAAREHVVGLDIVIGGGLGGRRGQIFPGRGRGGGNASRATRWQEGQPASAKVRRPAPTSPGGTVKRQPGGTPPA